MPSTRRTPAPTCAGVQEVCTSRGSTETTLMEQPCNGHILKPQTEESPVLWGGIFKSVCGFLLVVGLIREARGGYVKQVVLKLNAMFDTVWCPLPTWVHIVLAITAWALCFRVGEEFVKTWKRGGKTTK